MVRKCYCSSCPEHYLNETCELKPGGQCFTSIELEHDESEVWTYGCFAPADEEGGIILSCKGNLVPHSVPKAIECCDSFDMCNKNLNPHLVHKNQFTESQPLDFGANFTLLIILSFVIVFSLIITIIGLILCYKSKSKGKIFGKKLLAPKLRMLTDIPTSANLPISISQSSGSGAGMPLLVQRTIAKQIHLVQTVGKGRYGEVWKGWWRDEYVAVKIFLTTEEASWLRETELYRTGLLRHENILGFIASDIMGTGSWTQLFLITDFHPYGSLYDFLHSHILSKALFIDLATSAISGLTHLHTEIHGTQGKPAIAHRDIKSKNILVKKDKTCCIADMGLAVRYLSETNKVDIAMNCRQGTRRYMAPEVLDDSLDVRQFESFKQADVYSMALVLWEMTNRCASNNGLVDEYQVPYFDVVGADPSFEEMRKIVCYDGRRPEITARTNEDQLLREVTFIIKECWSQHPSGRLSALRIKKSLNKLRSNLNNLNAKIFTTDNKEVNA